MVPAEGVEGSKLHPPQTQLWCGIAVKSTNIRSNLDSVSVIIVVTVAITTTISVIVNVFVVIQYKYRNNVIHKITRTLSERLL